MRRFFLIIIAMAIGMLIFASTVLLLPQLNFNEHPENFYFGVSFCGNTTSEAKLLIDRVKDFTNILVVQSGPVSVNETALNEIVDYAVNSQLGVIAYFGYFNPAYPWQIPWLDYAKQTWGNHFLGIYLNDEPGGQTIDANWTGYFNQIRIRNTSVYYTHTPTIELDLAINRSATRDYNDAAYHFLNSVETGLGLQELKTRSIPAFTSDYALYWFDYKGGYDTIFAEFGSNHSITQTIALVRGAARMQNKDWGTIITWTYDQPPYLVDGAQMYSELMTAYKSGAKYAVIFDYPQIDGNPYGILTEDHFKAMQKFWSNIKNLRINKPAEVALVLPNNYGWAMRTPQDLIWGLWLPDNTSEQIWNISNKLLTQYGLDLDITYDDPQFPIEGRGYRKVYYWNQTV
ncbi:MAG: hypothetical protein NWE98_00915 [Candidatus Bathyarchaeota archaeon]|nr:hypothetical protein [Candidatus Bathyarchaeota archaeon]